MPINEGLIKNFRLWLEPYAIRRFTVRQFTDGGTNHTFLITEETGAMKVLRIYGKDRRAKERIEQEVDFMNFLRARGLPVPHLITNLNGTVISEFQAGDTIWPYVLMDFADGSHPEHYTRAVLAEMATQQAAIHNYGVQYAKQLSGPQRRGFFLRLPVPYGFSHCDFDATNLLVIDAKITCILDFEGMRYCPLVSCLFFTLRRIYDNAPDQAALKSYIAIYQKTRRLTLLERWIINIMLTIRLKRLSLLSTA